MEPRSTSTQIEDWDVEFVAQPAGHHDIFPISVNGSGGYATGFSLGCSLFQSIEGRADWEWTENGIEDSDFEIEIEILHNLLG